MELQHVVWKSGFECKSKIFLWLVLSRIYEDSVTWLSPSPKLLGVVTQKSLPRHGGPFPGPLRLHNGYPVTTTAAMEMSTGSCCYMSQSTQGPSPIHSTARQEVHSALHNVLTRKVLKSKCLFLSALWIVSPSHFNISHLRWRLWLKAHYTVPDSVAYMKGRGFEKSVNKSYILLRESWHYAVCVRTRLQRFDSRRIPGFILRYHQRRTQGEGGCWAAVPQIEF